LTHRQCEDDRFAYDEQRFVTLGLLAGIAVSIVHTETPSRIHLISFRKATRREEKILFKKLQD
jgi:uncharacterized protein